MGIDLVEMLAQRGEAVTVTSRSARKSEYSHVKYVQGDARDTDFLRGLLHDRYDAVVDFMVYSTEEFKERLGLLLDAAGQYVFLSSSRVYADSKEPITEDSPRLLDVTTDEKYLKTDEYALAKARQEDLLRKSGRTNWTVIRPYITYSSQRLQLGVYEKELWLYRALEGRTIIFPKDIAEAYTTMTLGKDVAAGIAGLIGNEKALGETFHITADRAVKWDNVLGIYKKVFQEKMGREIKVLYTDDPKPIYSIMGNKYQVIYDRVYDRTFNSGKILRFTGLPGEYTLPADGLRKCLEELLDSGGMKRISWGIQGYMDRMAGETVPLKGIPGIRERVKYLLYRFAPPAARAGRVIFRLICRR